ncbi:GHKL domain-containing protein [Aliivibrio fischeri]|uniref:sensor histidine kinase n=1 Tax=Aliivibrio fischeri TaxID=668 RepID=UPI0012D8E2DD|nr:HAMP domain-containing sensor histidine kinase [Aliivibrio fischeri]MUH97781.1 GHKL domain-containing protein [Aliivibrio fischeri]MUI62316.1 GHKL domain-containing protein [Aliivibrio fischeri]MUK39384.1 GHKL domain-containing protein [Aliivibrio fischeri]MUL03374.1 GHKL domain-containing protein [Aliivibrio fischeri]MUL07455.1 GHKL domain-containing protein [Aliivibrio fischeri]
MYSIKDRLVNALTVIIGVILLVVFLSLDFILDAWVDQQFDDALVEKSNYFKSLVEVENDGIEFEYHNGFMPQFERKENAQYFQIWLDEQTFAKSQSLSYYENIDLDYRDVATHDSRIFTIKLPDGSMGKAISSRFQPQLSHDVKPEDVTYIGSMYLTLAISNQRVSNILLFADLGLLFVFITAIFGVRTVVTKVVDRELDSLYILNKEISELDVNAEQIKENPKESKEIAPIRKELNRYIELNIQNVANEKRLSSDIAHELKTPIAEIISLSEMNIRFPDDVRISATYKEDVLSIANNMKNIVNQLMALNQSSSSHYHIEKSEVDIRDLAKEISIDLEFKYPDAEKRLTFISTLSSPVIYVDRFSLETVVKNLLDNALFYSTEGSEIVASIDNYDAEHFVLKVQNRTLTKLTEEHLENLFKPLYQVDKSRTHTGRHGLGLSIVKNIAHVNNYELSVDYTDEQVITFNVIIPKEQ